MQILKSSRQAKIEARMQLRKQTGRSTRAKIKTHYLNLKELNQFVSEFNAKFHRG